MLWILWLLTIWLYLWGVVLVYALNYEYCDCNSIKVDKMTLLKIVLVAVSWPVSLPVSIVMVSLLEDK